MDPLIHCFTSLPFQNSLPFRFQLLKALSEKSMQIQCLGGCGNLTLPRLFSQRCHLRLNLIRLPAGASNSDGKRRGQNLKAKGKENIWSVDNDRAEKAALRERRRKRHGTRRREKRNGSGRRDKVGSQVLVSGPMLMEVETVLQTQVLCLFLFTWTD